MDNDHAKNYDACSNGNEWSELKVGSEKFFVRVEVGAKCYTFSMKNEESTWIETISESDLLDRYFERNVFMPLNESIKKEWIAILGNGANMKKPLLVKKGDNITLFVIYTKKGCADIDFCWELRRHDDDRNQMDIDSSKVKSNDDGKINFYFPSVLNFSPVNNNK